MNDSMYRWLTNRGFTGSLEDATKQYLLSVVFGATGEETLHDLWMMWGIQTGLIEGAGLQRTQIAWAILQGSESYLTWNDAMGTLPP